MLNQSVSEKNLELLKGKTFQKHFKGSCRERFVLDVYKDVASKLEGDRYVFDDFVKKTLNSKQGYDCANAADELVLKKLNDNIKRLFKVTTADRHEIVKQSISLLKDSQPISIIRLDIKNFYESLDRGKIVDFINDEWLLSHQSRGILKSFNESVSLLGIGGLPRGLSISATFSELRMRVFDREVRKLVDVYYYGRFVDDIVIFCIGSPEKTFNELKVILGGVTPELEFNNKTYIFDANEEYSSGSQSFVDYLGYRIKFSSVPEREKPRELSVEISPKKINKIKRRIEKSFSSYNRTRTFKLLYARLKFLTGNQYIIGDIERTKLKSGIYYNYPLLTTSHQLHELDLYYQRLIRTKKGPVSRAVGMIRNHSASGVQVSRYNRIKKISFVFGFENKVMNTFDRKLNRKIKGCW